MWSPIIKFFSSFNTDGNIHEVTIEHVCVIRTRLSYNPGDKGCSPLLVWVKVSMNWDEADTRMENPDVNTFWKSTRVFSHGVFYLVRFFFSLPFKVLHNCHVMVSNHASDVNDSIFALESIRVVIDTEWWRTKIYILQ